MTDLTANETDQLKSQLQKVKYDLGRLEVRCRDFHEKADYMKDFLGLLQDKARRDKIRWLEFEIKEFLDELYDDE